MSEHARGNWEINEGNGVCVQWGDKEGQYAVWEADENYSGDAADARLIAAAPTMFQYIAAKAAEGDVAARRILEEINASGRHRQSPR